jgi:hypothetical protein
VHEKRTDDREWKENGTLTLDNRLVGGSGAESPRVRSPANQCKDVLSF